MSIFFSSASAVLYVGVLSFSFDPVTRGEENYVSKQAIVSTGNYPFYCDEERSKSFDIFSRISTETSQLPYENVIC